MIKDRNELRKYLEEDYQRFETKPCCFDILLRNEKWYIWQYIKALRHVEYYINTNKKGVLFLLWWLRYKRLCFKLRFNIAPNTIDAGLGICHVGDFIWVHSKCRIGKKCTLRPGVVFGRKCNEVPPNGVVVGNNCDFGIGSRIIGDVIIGNNVSVGSNAVITKDVPDNAVVVGVPAKVIKIKS